MCSPVDIEGGGTHKHMHYFDKYIISRVISEDNYFDTNAHKHTHSFDKYIILSRNYHVLGRDTHMRFVFRVDIYFEEGAHTHVALNKYTSSRRY